MAFKQRQSPRREVNPSLQRNYRHVPSTTCMRLSSAYTLSCVPPSPTMSPTSYVSSLHTINLLSLHSALQPCNKRPSLHCEKNTHSWAMFFKTSIIRLYGSFVFIGAGETFGTVACGHYLFAKDECRTDDRSIPPGLPSLYLVALILLCVDWLLSFLSCAVCELI